jgi:hypothetical protein
MGLRDRVPERTYGKFHQRWAPRTHISSYQNDGAVYIQRLFFFVRTSERVDNYGGVCRPNAKSLCVTGEAEQRRARKYTKRTGSVRRRIEADGYGGSVAAEYCTSEHRHWWWLSSAKYTHVSTPNV